MLILREKLVDWMLTSIHRGTDVLGVHVGRTQPGEDRQAWEFEKKEFNKIHAV